MASLRVATFTDPREFVEAVKDDDDCYWNFALGSLMDSLREEETKARDEITQYSRTIVCVFDGNALTLVLVQVPGNFAWSLACPSDRITSEADTRAATSLLAASLASIVDPRSLDKLFGPQFVVDIFLEEWIIYAQAHRIHIENCPIVFRSKASFATLSTLPPPPPILSKYKIELANSGDAEALAHLYVEFLRPTPAALSLDDAKKWMEGSIRLGQIWVCRVHDELAGYVATGRATPRTVAIRNVYVSPQHRRKGIAEAMTTATTRYLLGAQPLGFEGAPEGPPADGVKQEICLNVLEDFVERLYKTCGFLLGENDRDPVSGKKGWFATTLRTVQITGS